jgi:hypothetical protein
MNQDFHYYVGLDLGQARDYTAISVVEEPVWVDPSWVNRWAPEWNQAPEPSGWVSPARMRPADLQYATDRAVERGRPPNPPLFVRHLERFELGTRYPDVVDRVGELAAKPPIKHCRAIMLVDKTGVGASVLDSFDHAGVGANAITIHGGSEVTRDPQRAGFRVPKKDLVSAVQVLLQSGRLKIAEALPEAATLKAELLNFRAKINPETAHASFEHWREGDHDDLVLATAMACWFREFYYRKLERVYAEDVRLQRGGGVV